MFERLKTFWLFATTRSGRTLAAIEEENNGLREQLAQRVMDTSFVAGMIAGENGITFGLKGGACQLIAEAFADQFLRTGALNYLEINFTSKHISPGTRLVVTIQKCTGKTPHELRVAAENELAQMRATLTPNAI